ncbi:EAL domain-containing response regulator [Demequina zhanjiangensis]|uniref:EAL domain-containing response regulator n=1 Tax=Demequina zhanjiangensis TaxID=3051659 RepID=A0ABT8G2S8_9MICO|nr:EAL domain-containing response regulator [Demequina sp. SYSU T00b26]MDN4472999.1 EAL domain-containing response regulator [Demequina sp. SYSU T00b26]
MGTDRCPRVLVIDDDALVAAMAVAHARSTGYEARAASDPEQFLVLVREWKPCCVIVDLMMGTLDGIGVLKQLSQTGYRGAVIITSGAAPHLVEAARTYAIECGLQYAGTLPKPFRRGEVAALLDSPIDDARPERTIATEFAEKSYWGFSVALRKAIQDSELEIHLQPKVSCLDGRVTGAEVLARWNHPVLGSVPPATFVPYAEQIGLVAQLTDLISAQAVAWLASTSVPEHFTLSINLSAAELSEPGLARRLVDKCVEHGVPPRRLMLELTETSTVKDSIGSLEVLTRLGLEGFGLSIDDFGTGYSSVSQLARLPFSELKVDRSFVGAMSTSPRSATVVRSIIAMAEGLGLTSIAEGVETADQLRAVTEMGCSSAQGFHLARPMPASRFAAWMHDWESELPHTFLRAQEDGARIEP